MEAWRRELYLAHHGILGMKWGRKNGPPYPLDAQDHSASEKKAGWRKSLNGGSGEESKPKKRLTKENSGGKEKNHTPKFYSETPDWKLVSDRREREPEKASSTDVSKGKEIIKKALFAIGATSAVAIAAYALHKHNVKEAEWEKAHAFVKGWVRKNADVPVNSLGQIFSNGKEFHDKIQSIHENTMAKESRNELFDKKYWDGLSDAQREAVRLYTRQLPNDNPGHLVTYKGLNKFLRFGAESIPEQYRQEVQEQVEHCVNALEHSVIQEDTVCYRGISEHALKTVFKGLPYNIKNMDAEKLLNSTFTEKGFYSSSIDKDQSFDGIKITTIIPKGTKGMYVGPVSDYPYEKEILLQRGTKFKVKDFRTNSAGILISLVFEVVSQP